MKLVKMSLAAAMLMGASAFAVDNVKISGDAKVFYSTQDADNTGYNAVKNVVGGDGGGALFDKDSSAADAALHLNVSADLFTGISAGASYTAISTLGLENNFVSNVWGGSHGATLGEGNSYAGAVGGAKVDNASWFNEAWVAVSLGKSIAKVGRMELDTPLAFTETWSIERNSFEAAVLINQDLPGTTLVAAYVGNGNGTEFFGDGGMNRSPITDLGASLAIPPLNGVSLAVGPVVNMNGKFSTYGTDGAYAAGIVNNSLEILTLQGWYYDVSKLAQAYWLQADLNMAGIMAGAQYSNLDLGDINAGDNNVWAAMVGYEMKDVVTIKGAYSSVDKNIANIGAGWNTATAMGTAQSKLYTEAWWNYGYVTAAETDSFNISATGKVAMLNLGVYYTNADQSTAAGDNDLTEFTVTAGASVGPLDATLAYINTDASNQNGGDAFNMVQAYLTVNF